MEELLINKAKNGDDAAFDQLALKHQGAVLHTIHNTIRDPIDAQDVLQETLVEAYTHLNTLQDNTKFAAWLHSIARNRCRMWLRKHTRRISIEQTVEDGHIEFQLTETDYIPEHHHPPDHPLEYKELQKKIRTAIETLSDKNQQVTTMHYLDDLTYEEISNTLDIPISTIEGRLYRARQQLKEIMGMANKDIAKLETTLEAIQEEIKDLQNQVKRVTREEDWGISSERFAAAERFCRLPVGEEEPIAWGIVGAFRKGKGTGISRRYSFNTTDLESYLQKVTNDEVAEFAALFTNPITIAILKTIVRDNHPTIEEVASLCNTTVDKIEESLPHLIEKRLIAREGDKLHYKDCADPITGLLTLINLTSNYFGKQDD